MTLGEKQDKTPQNRASIWAWQWTWYNGKWFRAYLDIGHGKRKAMSNSTRHWTN